MLNVRKLDPRATLPTCANPGKDLGWDLYALEDTTLRRFNATRIRTGVAAHFTSGVPGEPYSMLVRDRSSMASGGCAVTGGVIDEGYRGEICVLMTYLGKHPGEFVVLAGKRIAQLIPMRVYTGCGVREVEELPVSARGDKGWGSSGR